MTMTSTDLALPRHATGGLAGAVLYRRWNGVADVWPCTHSAPCSHALARVNGHGCETTWCLIHNLLARGCSGFRKSGSVPTALEGGLQSKCSPRASPLYSVLYTV